jgi:hypothetical protein
MDTFWKYMYLRNKLKKLFKKNDLLDMSKTFWLATDECSSHQSLHSKHGNIFWKYVQLTTRYINQHMAITSNLHSKLNYRIYICFSHSLNFKQSVTCSYLVHCMMLLQLTQQHRNEETSLFPVF